MTVEAAVETLVEYVEICAHGKREQTSASSVAIMAQWDRVDPKDRCAPRRFERRIVTRTKWEPVVLPSPDCVVCGDLGILVGTKQEPCPNGCPEIDLNAYVAQRAGMLG